MDFEWNGQSHGPTDPNSPFPKPKPGQKGKLHNRTVPDFKKVPNERVGGFGNLPQTPSSFMSAGAFKSAPSFRNPSFTTPRKPFDADLFSEASGIDSSPGDNADAEDTPEPSKDKAMTIFADKQPSFGRYGAEFRGNSPGRIDLRKGKYAQAVIANKARKRKRKDRDYTLSRTHIDSDDEDDAEEEREKTRGKAKKEAKPHWFGSILSGVESRPNLPSVLSTYLQLGLNLFLLMITIYMITMFFLTIRSDVDMASEKMKQEVVSEIAHCTQEYVANRCSKDMRVRAMEEQCNQWQLCMDMDPSLVGRARVSAKTFAQILDSFIEPISWKALVSLHPISSNIFTLANELPRHLLSSFLGVGSSSTILHLPLSENTFLNHSRSP